MKWEKFKSTDNKDVPFLDYCSFDGIKLRVFVNFKNHSEAVQCDDILSFKMIEESHALKTLYEQDFNGSTWIFKTSNSELVNLFNIESENIHVGEFLSYIIVTQHHIIELLTHSNIKIDVTSYE